MAALDGELPPKRALAYVAAQLLGGIGGVWLTHAVFDHRLLELSTHPRGLLLSELVASAVLLAVIRIGVRIAPERMPMLVAMTVTAGYWFTASTFFANPAVTVARAFSDTFAGITPASVPGFVLAQLGGLSIVMMGSRLLKGMT
jgi:glycerol uptake facilitator-like aquaporin